VARALRIMRGRRPLRWVRLPGRACAPQAWITCLAFLVGAFLALPAAAQVPGGAFDITADAVDFETERRVYVARGNVHIVQEGRTLDADWVAYSLATGQGVATGDVVIREGSDVLTAEVIHFNVNDLKGIILDGQLKTVENGYVVTGRKLRKTGAATYEVEDGSFTTCDCPEEERKPWKIEADEAEITVGGYATLKNSTIEMLEVPVFWLPWMRLPVKQDRETGLLLPEYNGSDRNGTDIGIPFFWAARDNINVLFTPRWLEEHGFKPDFDFEYVFGDRNGGSFFASFLLDDRSIDPDDPSTPFSSDRWAFEWIHQQHFGEGWRWMVDGRVFSDNLYPFDFTDFADSRSDRYVESYTFVDKRFLEGGTLGFFGGVRVADDMQNPDDQDRDPYLLQRLPEVNGSGLPYDLGFESYVSFDADYTYFTGFHKAENELGPAVDVGGIFLDTGIESIPNGQERNAAGVFVLGDGSLDDFPGPERNGLFDEGEALADRGSRLSLNPRFGRPFRLFDAVEIFPEVGYVGDLYQTTNQDFDSRHLMTGLLDVSSQFNRELDIGGRRALHLFEPRVTYTGVLNVSQDNNPLFVPRSRVLQERIRALEPTTITRDPADRVDGVNAVTLGLGNRIMATPFGNSESDAATLWADVDLVLNWDFDNDEFHDVFLDGVVFPWEFARFGFNTGYDIDSGTVREGLAEVGYSDPEGYDLAVSYRLVRDIPRFYESFRFDRERFKEFEQGFLEINQATLFTRIPFWQRFAVTYGVAYSFEQSIWLSNVFGFEFISKCRCWAVRIEGQNDRTRGLKVGVGFRILGIGDDSVRPFQGGRSPKRQAVAAAAAATGVGP
jgi:lipopolysaccharide assembly outer membrane protein LptD (OstA)